MGPRRRALIALALVAAAAGAIGWALRAQPPADAPPDRAETEEMMREIGYVQ